MRPSRAYAVIQRVLQVAVRAFFRRVETVGTSNVPRQGGGLLVSWHPNGLVDPALILTRCPRQVVFGARHGLFRYPGLGTLLERVGTVPIYRAIDLGRETSPEARRAANRRSLDALAERVAGGSFSALFPEGVSHDEPFLRELKTGAARLYYRARQLAPEGAPLPVIVCVGLHYDEKQMFRSNAMVAFHPVVPLPAELDVTPSGDVESDEVRQLSRRLTELLETQLREVVHATDDWDLHHLMHRTRRLVRAERAHRSDADPGKTTIGERVLGFARVRAGYYAMLERDPQSVATLRHRMEAYDEGLRALGLEDYDLDRPPRLVSKWLALLVVLQAFGVFLLLPPLVALGYLVNLPTASLLALIAWLAARKQKDAATVKLLAGLVAFPLTWIGVGVLAGLGHTWLHETYPRVPDTAVLSGITMATLSAVGGAAGVRYWRVARETARAVRVRLTRQRSRLAIANLRVERAELHDAIVDLVADIELPGTVAEDGRILPS
jgi:glycerol-3-phosphate O-acyltransferase / dihydroxyacetone phosphate acyltransferase